MEQLKLKHNQHNQKKVNVAEGKIDYLADKQWLENVM